MEPTKMEPTLEILLHQYRVYMVNKMITRISGRIVFIGILVLMLFKMESKLPPLIWAYIAIPLGIFWFFEERFLDVRLAWLGELIGKHSRDIWEDVYIQSRHNPHDEFVSLGRRIGQIILRMEPICWILWVGLVGLDPSVLSK